MMGDFHHYLRDNSKVVLECTTAAGSVTAGGTNTGTGVPVISILNTWNESNQNIQNADFWVTCTSDAVTGSATQHAEKFIVQSSFEDSIPNITACMVPGADGTGAGATRGATAGGSA